ncbi:Transposase [Theobroma cacao]|nr:Transposase [Theobroma cacao]
MRGVRSDLSFVGLMKLVEDVVGVNSEIDESELHALISSPGELSRPIIKDDEDVALILLEQRMFRLYRFDDTSDDGLEQSQDDSSDDDCLYDSDIPICNNVEGETEPVGGVDIGDVQCDDPIYNNPIAERFSFQTITTEELTCAGDHLYNGIMFLSKAELKRALNMLVIKEKFEIRVKRSCKACYEVGCKDKACKFSVRATKLPDRGEYWKFLTFHKVHTCTVDGLRGRFPTTSAKMIGELMSHKIRANGVALRPKDIICEMRVQWELEFLYGKAWQAKEYTKRLVFDPSEESFQLLPSYFYMLKQENPGIVTAVATDEEEIFKYYF